MMNIHSEYIDKRIQDIIKGSRWSSKLVDTSHEEFVRDYSKCVFTNLVRDTFTSSYMKKFACSDCEAPATDRCHGVGESRPLLLKRALARVWPDTSKPITMKEIIVAFLEEHKNTKFTFKCHQCHLKENNFKNDNL